MPTISYDENTLIEMFRRVNARYFKGIIKADVVWDVPPVRVTRSASTKSPAPTASGAPLTFSEEMVAEAKKNFDLAEEKYGPLAERGNRGAAELLCIASRATRPDRHSHWNRVLIGLTNTLSSAPASCYVPGDSGSEAGRIFVHPFIRTKKAPGYVLRYVLYHECVHQIVPVDGVTQHPPAFMEYEKAAPGRVKAMVWLSANGFPTLDGDAPPPVSGGA